MAIGTAGRRQVDPSLVPSRTLRSGATIPAIGMGTFGSDHAGAEKVAKAVEGGIKSGYRLIDCASCYGNEHLVGPAIKAGMGEEVSRDEMFVVSKVWNDQHTPEGVEASLRQSLEDLQLDYLDAYLVHWPFPNYHEPFASPDARNPKSRPYIHEEFMQVWRAMEKLVDEGLVRHIGTSNMTVPKLELVIRDARIQPAVNEMELHPTFQQGELLQFCLDNDILPIGFSPIGSPKRPERDRTADDFVDIEMPQVKEVAERHGIHPAVVCLKWAVQRGQVPIPFSTTEEYYVSNLQAVVEDPLTPEDMHLLRSAERNCRLIKGQVFLWPGSDSWIDLWDVDGTIPGWNGYGS